MKFWGNREFRLTRFRWRKRFYLLGGLASPRNAAIFWLGWCILQSSFWGDLRLAVFGGLPRSWMVSFWSFTVAGWGVLWFFGIWMLSFAYYGLVHRCRWLRSSDARGVWKLIALLTAVFPFYSAVVLAPCLWRKGRGIWAAVAAAGTLAAVAGWGCWGWGLNPWLRWGLGLTALIVPVVALTAFPDGARRRWRAWIPWGLVAVELAAIWSVYGVLQGRIRETEGALERLGGRPVNLVAFWREQRQRRQLDEDPVWRDFMTKKRNGMEQAEYETNCPEWVEALKQISGRAPEPIGHKPTESVMPWGISLDHLSPLRAGAQYFRLKTMQNPEDREAVLDYQQKMRCLRDWALADDFLIAKLVAVAIESIRLQSLSYVLADETFTAEEWEALTAPEVNWLEVGRDGLMAEAVLFHAAVWYSLQVNPPKPDWLDRLWGKENSEPVGGKVMLARDYLAGITCLERQIAILLAPDLSYADRAEGVAEAFPQGRCYIFTNVMLGASEGIPRALAQVEDYRRMARATYRIDAMFRASGKLPEAPAFLAEPEYRSALAGEPFQYEYGNLTGEDGKAFRGFRLSVTLPLRSWERTARSCIFAVAY